MMNSSDGNAYALEKHLAEIEAHEAARDKICPDCEEVILLDDYPVHHRDDQCPDCDSELVFLCDYEPSEADQGLIPIPDGYAKPNNQPPRRPQSTREAVIKPKG